MLHIRMREKREREQGRGGKQEGTRERKMEGETERDFKGRMRRRQKKGKRGTQ